MCRARANLAPTTIRKRARVQTPASLAQPRKLASERQSLARLRWSTVLQDTTASRGRARGIPTQTTVRMVIVRLDTTVLLPPMILFLVQLAPGRIRSKPQMSTSACHALLATSVTNWVLLHQLASALLATSARTRRMARWKRSVRRVYQCFRACTVPWAPTTSSTAPAASTSPSRRVATASSARQANSARLVWPRTAHLATTVPEEGASSGLASTLLRKEELIVISAIRLAIKAQGR